MAKGPASKDLPPGRDTSHVQCFLTHKRWAPLSIAGVLGSSQGCVAHRNGAWLATACPKADNPISAMSSVVSRARGGYPSPSQACLAHRRGLWLIAGALGSPRLVPRLTTQCLPRPWPCHVQCFLTHRVAHRLCVRQHWT